MHRLFCDSTVRLIEISEKFQTRTFNRTDTLNRVIRVHVIKQKDHNKRFGQLEFEFLETLVL